MICDLMIAQLQARFPDRGLRITDDTPPIMIFPAIHPDVGDIEVHDDDDEVTVFIGSITHGHFGNYDEGLARLQRDQLIVDAVIAQLELIFSEKTELYRTSWGGGWGPRGTGTGEVFVWSGPVSGKHQA